MLDKWSTTTGKQRRVLFEAAWNLAAAQLAIRLLPFRWIVPSLGHLGEDPADRSVSQEQTEEARRIGWAVTALASYVPWDPRCLAQAVAGKWMLHRRGIPSTLYLGVKHADEGEQWLEAHAWLRCGTEIITGERQHDRFDVLTSFSEHER